MEAKLIKIDRNGSKHYVGEIVNVAGTIKAHSEYKDERQTELTRCKVTAA